MDERTFWYKAWKSAWLVVIILILSVSIYNIVDRICEKQEIELKLSSGYEQVMIIGCSHPVWKKVKSE